MHDIFIEQWLAELLIITVAVSLASVWIMIIYLVVKD